MQQIGLESQTDLFFFFHQQRVRLSKTQERDVSLKQRGIWSWLSSTQTFASLRTVN